MRGNNRRHFVLSVFIAMGTLLASAFPEIPRESARALKITRGKSFSAGAVFINGKYIEPPYMVERWGTGLRVNSIPVTGQVIDWADFIRTQENVRTILVEAPTEVTPSQEPASPPPPPEPVIEKDDELNESSLDDLFDDDPKPAKKSKPKVRKPLFSGIKPVAKPAAPTMTYELEGDFVPNEATKSMLAKINALRTETDRLLRSGKFICFGDDYSRVVGDEQTFLKMLEVLPELMQQAADARSFRLSVRAAKLDYLNDQLCDDLFKNKVDYRKLKMLRERMKKDQEWKQMLDKGQPLF